ncbi:metal-dependent hydrolase [Aquirhabdus sp.]|uniref:metal-dependent hydrolase n=1 Tax=Aquirhabdus sp. TaxID=2824160 RepID=UPI00396C42C6
MNTLAYDPIQQHTAHKGAGTSITVRHMDLKFSDDTPEFWFANNPLLTAFFTAFSCSFPEGERQFIHSVRHFQDRIKDPELSLQIRAFIGQEAHHGKEHDALNEMMRRKGYSVDRIYNRFKKMNRLLRDNFSPARQLAATVCMEHITAIMADYFLRIAPESQNLIAHGEMRKLWVWHSIEESEHKAVAFDVYQTAINRRWLLRYVMVETTIVAFRGTMEMLRDSGHSRDLKSWRQGLGYLSGMLGSIRKPYSDFFRKDFHPWQHDNTAEMNHFKQVYQIDVPPVLMN